jgi:disulfide oxidoreductase YuzD
MELPMIIFTSCSLCHSCIKFRGENGKPSFSRDTKEWCYPLIKSYLSNNIKTKLKCLRIINIHDSNFGAEIKNISEFNLYHLIPSNLVIDNDFFIKIMSDDNPYFGDSVLTVSLTRSDNSLININVEIDGNSEDRRCESIKVLVEDFFIWRIIHLDFLILRDHFISAQNGLKTDNFEKIISDELRNDPFYGVLIKNYHTFCKSPKEYEKLIMLRFNYDWFLDTFFPKRLRELEIMYPSWILISPASWKEGLDTDNPIYAKIACCNTTLNGNRFVSLKQSNETMADLLIQYGSGRLPLNYEKKLLSEKKKYVTFNT